MNIVDSSGWLEYFADGSNVEFFSPAVEKLDELIVPSITIHEVFKVVLQQKDEDKALQAISIMQQGHIIDLDNEIAINAARISHDLKLPMADSIILATSLLYNATIWTQDADFKSIDNARYVEKK